jgi:fluoride exporter
MSSIILVGVGSFVGGILRYGLNTWVHRVLGSPWFPFGTLAVNVIGCLVIGFLTGLAESWTALSSETRLFVFVGVLGGFTTFSAFALESYALARDTHHGAALVNIGLQVMLGLLAVWIGHLAGRSLAD